MVAVLLFIGAITFAASMIFLTPGTKKIVWVSVGLILAVGSCLLMIFNYNAYLGMKEVQTSETKPLAQIGRRGERLQYRKLGTKNERVYIYRDNPLERKIIHTNPATSHTKLVTKAKANSVTITTTRRVYRNEEWRLLFANGVPDHQLVRTDYVFRVKKPTLISER